jgi:uncharacterized protein YjiS (DUF1127 family)
MAYVNSRSATVSISDRVANLVKSVKDAVERRRVYTQTVRELSGLSDRDLTDLGLARGNIYELAREAAYMN